VNNKILHNVSNFLNCAIWYRILCGRRKGSVMLLGGAWCKDLDGGNPLVDRSCLLNTARRAVYSQSLLDIFAGTNLFDCGGGLANGHSIESNLIKLCEISYHRPKEDTKGKTYPEQVIAPFNCFI